MFVLHSIFHPFNQSEMACIAFLLRETICFIRINEYIAWLPQTPHPRHNQNAILPALSLNVSLKTWDPWRGLDREKLSDVIRSLGCETSTFNLKDRLSCMTGWWRGGGGETWFHPSVMFTQKCFPHNHFISLHKRLNLTCVTESAGLVVADGVVLHDISEMIGRAAGGQSGASGWVMNCRWLCGFVQIYYHLVSCEGSRRFF